MTAGRDQMTEWRLPDNDAQRRDHIRLLGSEKIAQQNRALGESLARRLGIGDIGEQIRHFSCSDSPSLRIVKDHTERMTPAGFHAADAMAQIDAIAAARALNRPVMHGEHHRIALPQVDHFGA